MDFFSKLSSVLKLFLRLKKPISDDTSLHRLVDLIEKSYKENPNDTGTTIVEFLQSVVDDIKCIEPSITTFALTVCGIVASKPDFYTTHHDLVQQLFSCVSKHKLKNDLSVRTAYFNSLALISDKLTWNKDEHFMKEYIQEAYTTLTENFSLFPQSAAREFLVTIIVKQFTETDIVAKADGCLGKLTKKVQGDLVKGLQEALKQEDTAEDRIICSMLELWLDLLTAAPESSCLLVEDANNVEVLLMKLCLHGPKILQHIGEILLIKYLQCRVFYYDKPECEYLNLSETVIPILEDELECSDFLAKHRMATNMLEKLRLDKESSQKLKAINNVPLYFLFGAKLPRKTNLASVQETASKKSLLTRLLVQTLDVNLFDPKRHVMFVSLLACTDANRSVHLLKCSPNVQQHLIANSKLQLKLMSTISYLADSNKLNEACLRKAFDVILNVIGQPKIDPRLYKGGQTSLLSLLSMMTRLDCNSPAQRLSKFTNLLEKRFVDTQWEVRDSAIEGLKKIILEFTDNEKVLMQVAASCIVRSAWRCYADANSYVRASSFVLISVAVKHPQIWKQFVSEKDCQEDNLVAIALDILHKDTEAFARRAAVDFIYSFYCRSKSHLSSSSVRTILTAVCSAIADFDWEVKSSVLNFIEMFIYDTCDPPETTPEQGEPNTRNENLTAGDKISLSGHLIFLEDVGGLQALKDGLDDFDNPIQQQSCTILIDFKNRISLSKDFGDFLKTTEDEIAKLLNLNDFNSENASSAKEKLSKFLCFLRDADFEVKLKELNISVEEYVRNPASILDDILRAELTQDTEENVVDCY